MPQAMPRGTAFTRRNRNESLDALTPLTHQRHFHEKQPRAPPSNAEHEPAPSSSTTP